MHLQISFFVTFVKKKSGLCASRAFPPMGGHYAKRALRSKCVYSINLISNIFFPLFSAQHTDYRSNLFARFDEKSARAVLVVV